MKSSINHVIKKCCNLYNRNIYLSVLGKRGERNGDRTFHPHLSSPHIT